MKAMPLIDRVEMPNAKPRMQKTEAQPNAFSLSKWMESVHRMVICLTMSPPLLVTPPSLELIDAVPGFFSKIFQNFRLSSAAAQGLSSGTFIRRGHGETYLPWRAFDRRD